MWLALASLVAWLCGCSGGGGSSPAIVGPGGSGTPYVATLKKGDLVEIKFSGNPTPPDDLEERIKEDGTINLPYIGTIQAEGKTAGQLQSEIQSKYVPAYYVRLTVTVRTELREFYVDGEVRRNDRFIYTGEMTVLKAIAAAGGFTDFAAKRRVVLFRTTGERVTVDAEKAKQNTSLDLPVIPGDRVFVPRRSVFGR